MTARFDLKRFVEAQAGVYAQVHSELASGQKRSHWMWFIFPQIKGLGSSPMAVRYALESVEEAREYLAHPLLGARLRECTGLVLDAKGKSVEEIFGYPDDLKFHSSMTLFARGAEGETIFAKALDRFFDGAMDRGTLERI